MIEALIFFHLLMAALALAYLAMTQRVDDDDDDPMAR